jgi:hypothetical protein
MNADFRNECGMVVERMLVSFFEKEKDAEGNTQNIGPTKSHTLLRCLKSRPRRGCAMAWTLSFSHVLKRKA